MKPRQNFNAVDEKCRNVPFQKVERMASTIFTISEKLISNSTIIPSLSYEGRKSSRTSLCHDIDLFCFHQQESLSLRPSTVCWWPGGSSSPEKVPFRIFIGISSESAAFKICCIFLVSDCKQFHWNIIRITISLESHQNLQPCSRFGLYLLELSLR